MNQKKKQDVVELSASPSKRLTEPFLANKTQTQAAPNNPSQARSSISNQPQVKDHNSDNQTEEEKVGFLSNDDRTHTQAIPNNPSQAQSSIINQPQATDNNSNNQVEEGKVESIEASKSGSSPYEVTLAEKDTNYHLYMQLYVSCIRIIIIDYGLPLIMYAVLNLALSRYGSDLNEDQKKTVLPLVVSGGCAFLNAAVLLVLRNQELKKMAEIVKSQWTENLFSIQVKNLPKDTTVADVTKFFNETLLNNNINAEVKYVVFLQDLHQCDEYEEKLIDLPDKDDDEEVNKIKNDLKVCIFQEHENLLNHRRFQGKAIIIFSTIDAKLKILNLPLKFRENNLISKDIVDPDDYAFAKVHYPKTRRTKIIKWVIIIIAIIIVIGIGITVIAVKQIDPFDIRSIVVIATTRLILKKVYNFAVAYVIYPYKSSFDLNRLNYLIFMGLLLYIIVPLLKSDTESSDFSSQIFVLGVEYWGLELFLQAMHWLAYRASIKLPRKPSVKVWAQAYNWIREKIIIKPFKEFDLADGIASAFPIIALGFSYSIPMLMETEAIDIIIIKSGVPLACMVLLFIFKVFYKFRIDNYCVASKLRSPDYALKAMSKVFAFVCLPLLVGGIRLTKGHFTISDFGSLKGLYYLALVLNFLCFIIILTNFRPRREEQSKKLLWTVSSYEIVKYILYREIRQVSYDDVYNHFPSRYQDKDPIRKIPRNKKVNHYLNTKIKELLICHK